VTTLAGSLTHDPGIKVGKGRIAGQSREFLQAKQTKSAGVSIPKENLKSKGTIKMKGQRKRNNERMESGGNSGGSEVGGDQSSLSKTEKGQSLKKKLNYHTRGKRRDLKKKNGGGCREKNIYYVRGK